MPVLAQYVCCALILCIVKLRHRLPRYRPCLVREPIIWLRIRISSLQNMSVLMFYVSPIILDCKLPKNVQDTLFL